ncbi:MAG: carbohydrate kinase [Desulfobacterales bacterium]|nr:MAG: carbohydrate kinase [Desulfobacterales bacterium]
MPRPFLLGIDAGTSLVKAVVFDHQGHEVGLARARVPIETVRKNWAEEDMEQVWEAVKETIRMCLQENKIAASDIAGIGVTGQGDGCRLIDRRLRPVRKSILWIDGRAGEIITAWEKAGLGRAGFDISGSAVFSGAPAAILEWLRRHEPDCLKEAAHFLFAKDWIKLQLIGEIATDASDASRAPFDIRKGGYSADLFEMLGLSEFQPLFPKIRPSIEVIGEVTRAAARETGLRAGTPVINGMIDVVACGVGVGAVNHGQAYSIVGTTCFNGVIMDRVDLEPAGIGMTLAYAFANQILRAMPSLAGTPNLDWFVEQFCGPEKAQAAQDKQALFKLLEEEVRKVPVGCEGLVYHPYINPGGERAPFVKPSATAQFFGLSLNHSRWHLLRAVYEGVVLSMLDCYEHIPIPMSKLMLCGGGAQSPLWCQIIADATGKSVQIPSGSELGALGASMMTALATGIYQDIREAVDRAVKITSVFAPNPENNQLYRKLYRLYQSLYEHAWDDWDRRARLLSEMETPAG